MEFLKPKPKITPWEEDDTPCPHTPDNPPLVLPEKYFPDVACVIKSDVDRNCKGMLILDRFKTLYTAFHKAELAGKHGTIDPPPLCFLGLISRSTLHLDNYTSTKKIVYHTYEPC